MNLEEWRQHITTPQGREEALAKLRRGELTLEEARVCVDAIRKGYQSRMANSKPGKPAKADDSIFDDLFATKP